MSEKRTISKPEIFWIFLESIIGLGGLTFIVLGIVADYLPVKASENYLGQAEFLSATHLTYRWFGVILLLAATALAVITLTFFANRSEQEEERAARKAQRLKVISETLAPEAAPSEAVVDVTPAEPKEE